MYANEIEIYDFEYKNKMYIKFFFVLYAKNFSRQ